MNQGADFFERLRAELKRAPPKSIEPGGMLLKEAAVLAALFWRGGEPWVYLTMRPMTMRKHPGQISFPGGARDPDDLTPEHLFDVLDSVAVRRTRSFVKQNYAFSDCPACTARLLPADAVYRALLKPEVPFGNLVRRMPGRVMIDGDEESILAGIYRRIIATIIREMDL